MIKANYFKITTFAIALLVIGCTQNINVEEEIKMLKQTDLEFSNLSKKQGANKAFLTYVHQDGVLLRPNNNPIVGKKSVREHLEQFDDSKYTLTWEPLFADISQSGDLGYTYGKYKFESEGKTSFGTYVSIWKKDEKGNWKFVLDTGNEGLEK